MNETPTSRFPKSQGGPSVAELEFGRAERALDWAGIGFSVAVDFEDPLLPVAA